MPCAMQVRLVDYSWVFFRIDELFFLCKLKLLNCIIENPTSIHTINRGTIKQKAGSRITVGGYYTFKKQEHLEPNEISR